MPAPRSTLALVAALLLGGCASAGHTVEAFGDADAVRVAFPRVSAHAMTVQLGAPAHTAFLEMRPGNAVVARWLEAGSQALPAGAHPVALDGSGFTVRRSTASRACGRPGEMPYYDLDLARTVASPTDIREVRSRGQRIFCVRTSSSTPRVETLPARHVLVVVSPEPVDPAALEAVRMAFNERHANRVEAPDVLVRAFTDVLADHWPGSATYYVRVPTS